MDFVSLIRNVLRACDCEFDFGSNDDKIILLPRVDVWTKFKEGRSMHV